MSEEQHKRSVDPIEAYWDLLEQTQQLIEGERVLTPSEHVPDFSHLSPESTESSEHVPVLEISGMGLSEIEQAVRSCTRCPLHDQRTFAVPGEGVLQPKVMIIGEAPGKHEDEQGRPFVGPSGQYLDEWMKAVGLSREKDLFIGNIIKCRPPQNRDPSPEEQSSCLPYLRRQIELIKPKSILCLGRVAAQILLQTEQSLGSLRGKTHRWGDIPLIVTYHPSAVLRYPDKFRRPVWEDLKRLSSIMGPAGDGA